ncbi:alpha/beta fold hydrolase [Halorubellus sp. PRR65]|uniref:alpha/beta hydrolase n=1 Tax=Halorubellus sp. PRR65 TaxID=3098148 RepID=UPI002B25FBA8|nr:alpha/beta fold hydrolase [Halorubellus sp. PRR65]
MDSSSRRRVLQVLATGTAVGVAGCAGGTDTETEPTTAGSTTTEPTTGTTASSTTDATTEEPVALTDEERVALAKRVTMELADGDFQAVHDRLTDTAAGQLSVDQLAQAWATYGEPLGAFRGATVEQVAETRGQPLVVLRATFERGVLRVVTVFDGERLSGLQIQPVQQSYQPPAYADEDAFVERARTLASPACDLGATLTLPTAAADGDSTVPGVVLVHGSGPNDRNESFGPNRPFQDLAWGLASRGVAVLRYDKRTFACDRAREDGLGLDALTVDDAVTALDVLRGEDAVGSVAVVGHSQGGMAAPRIAARADVDGMASLAGSGGSLAELVAVQVEYLANVDGAVSDAEREQLDSVRDAVDRIQAGDLGDDEVVLGYHADFWRDLAAYDQTAVAADLSVPRYVAFGGRDYQVPVERERPPWADALADAANATLRTYESANHLFLPGEGPSTPGEYLQRENVVEALVDDLAAWTDDL